MPDRSETTIRECPWRVAGCCSRPFIQGLREAAVNILPGGGGGGELGNAKRRAIRAILRRAVETGAVLEDSPCNILGGKRCRHDRVTPCFNAKTLELSILGVVLRQFRCPCRQMELLKAFELAGWPDFIKEPLCAPAEVDAENGLRDIVCELNKIHNWDSPYQVSFWNDPHDGGVHWEIAATPRQQIQIVPSTKD